MATTDVFNKTDKFLLAVLETTYNTTPAASTLDEDDLFYAEGVDVNTEKTIIDRMPHSGQRPGLLGVTSREVGAIKFTAELTPKTLTSSSAVVPPCHALLLSSGWVGTHGGAAQTWTYVLRDYSHASLVARYYEWDEDHSHAWQWSLTGIRGNGVIKAPAGDRATIEYDAKSATVARALIASGSVPDITSGNGFYTELPIVHENATVTITDTDSSETYDGCLMDLELRPNFTVEEQLCAEADGAITRIWLSPNGNVELDLVVETVADSGLDPYTAWENNTRLRVQVQWKDLAVATNTIDLDCYGYISSIEKEDDREGRQVLTLKMKLVWSSTVPGNICTLTWTTPP